MKNIVVIFAQPIENNTSSMIRGRNIVNEIVRMGNKVVCYSPYPDISNKYYDVNSHIEAGMEIRRYGKVGTGKKPVNLIDKKKTFKQFVIGIIYQLYKKIDLFGSSIFCIKYKKQISEEVKKENFDIILSFSDPKTAHIIAGYCKKKNNKMRYIQQWGDPLTEDITNRSNLPRCLKWLIEKRLLNKADLVYYVSPITLDSQKRLFRKFSAKMRFLPTPCEECNYPPTNNEKLTLGYLGSYNLVARDIRPFYEAACKCTGLNYIFVGDSDVILESKENIQIIDRVSQNELAEYINKVDILVCLMNSRGTQIPGKLYNYAGTNKEILVIQDGDCGEKIKDFFEQYNRYTFVENTVESIQRVLEMYVMHGIRNRTCVEDFRVANIVGKLLE